MKYRKYNKYEKKEIRSTNIANAMSGGGVYIYENSSAHADLKLPRPTRSGVKEIGPSGRFQGDDYYMQLVKVGMLRLVQVVQTAEQEQEALKQELIMEQQKLIVDQPDRVTSQGKVEQVVEKPKARKLNEGQKKAANEVEKLDVLLNESPDNDGFLIVT